MSQIKCFKSELNKLKASSKEAVEGVDNVLSPFKEYMHVVRNVQKEFEKLIEESIEVAGPQLILVCGSVGDGKSHLISYERTHDSKIDANFSIYNDATESLDPKKTSIETLNDELNDFSDENLGKNQKKMILAINLGTLTNFIDSEFGERYGKLKEYIKEMKILEQEITDNQFNCNSIFQYINFTDYHMYTLTSKGPKSKYMKEVLDRVFSTDVNNPFYSAYKQTCCNNCINFSRCPIKENYENLLREEVKEKIVQMLIEAIVKEKVIVSTRALLNFIYDIIVDSSLDNLSDKVLLNRISHLPFKDYLKALTANIVFDNKEASNIISALHHINPLNLRNEEIDALIVNLNNTEKLGDYFKKYIKNSEVHFYYKMLVQDDTLEVVKNLPTKTEKTELTQMIIKFFLRLTSIMPKEENGMFVDQVYERYMKYLYHSNCNHRTEMKEILDFVKDTIYRWNGPKLKEGLIHLSLGKSQSKFKVYENLVVMGKIHPNTNSKDELEKFIQTIYLLYEVKSNPDSVQGINIDFALFDLLVKVREGYRPNKKDKNNYINFVDFVKKLQQYGSNTEKILFDTKIGDKNHSFEFKVDEYGDYCLVEI